MRHSLATVYPGMSDRLHFWKYHLFHFNIVKSPLSSNTTTPDFVDKGLLDKENDI